MKYDRFSLRSLITGLISAHPGISEIYLFGSRRHRTRSTRSDVDILVTASDDVRPEDVRDFALANCPALDIFFVDRGAATSCANGSKVRGTSKRDLLSRLDALELWNSSVGFLSADVDWDFEVIKDQKMVMTMMISSTAFPSKALAISSLVPADAAAFPKWDFKYHPLVVIVTAMAVAAAATFAITYQLRIVPLENTLADERRPSESRIEVLPGKTAAEQRGSQQGSASAARDTKLESGPTQDTLARKSPK